MPFGKHDGAKGRYDERDEVRKAVKDAIIILDAVSSSSRSLACQHRGLMSACLAD